MVSERKHVSDVSRDDPEPKQGQQIMSSDEILDTMNGKEDSK